MMSMQTNNINVDDEARQQQRLNISTVEAAASTVLSVLRKYTTDLSSLPSSLNPADIISTDNAKEIGWEINKSSPWYNVSEAFDEIIMAREGLVKAWASTTTKTSNKDGDEYTESNSCWNSKSGDKGSSEGGGQRRRTQQIDSLNMVDSSNNLNDNDGEGDDGWWQSIIPSANKITSSVTTTTTARENNCVTTTTPIDNDRFVDVNDNYNNKMVPLTPDEQRTFTAVHLEYITAIFGDELDAIRQGTLEEYCITKNKNKASPSSSRKEANNVEDDAMIKNAAGHVELDPTHYSFVVSTSKGKRERGEGGLDTAAAAATTSSAATSNIAIQVLSNMLHSWADIYTLSEQRMLLMARQRAQQQQQQLIPSASSGLLITPHARQKRKVGFLSIDDIEIQRN